MGIHPRFAISARVGRIAAPLLGLLFVPVRIPASGVGKYEDTLSEVGRSDLGRGEHTPFRIEPELGKISQHGSHSSMPGKEARHVFQERKSRSYLADNSGDIGPKPSIVFFSEPLSGNRHRLARKARCDDIHDSTKAFAIKGCDIVPDRRRIQGLFLHPGHENGRREGVPLNIGESSIGLAQGLFEAKLGASNPGTKSQAIHLAPLLLESLIDDFENLPALPRDLFPHRGHVGSIVREVVNLERALGNIRQP